jgi:hypothetical protein
MYATVDPYILKQSLSEWIAVEKIIHEVSDGPGRLVGHFAVHAITLSYFTGACFVRK